MSSYSIIVIAIVFPVKKTSFSVSCTTDEMDVMVVAHLLVVAATLNTSWLVVKLLQPRHEIGQAW
jgi:hypothetical protein